MRRVRWLDPKLSERHPIFSALGVSCKGSRRVDGGGTLIAQADVKAKAESPRHTVCQTWAASKRKTSRLKIWPRKKIRQKIPLWFGSQILTQMSQRLWVILLPNLYNIFCFFSPRHNMLRQFSVYIHPPLHTFISNVWEVGGQVVKVRDGKRCQEGYDCDWIAHGGNLPCSSTKMYSFGGWAATMNYQFMASQKS